METDAQNVVTTAEELIRLPSGTHRYELVEGRLIVSEPAGIEHGGVAATMSSLLGNHVEDHELGSTFAAGTGFILSRDPDTVRAPDGAFISKDRLAASGIPAGYWEGGPDVAVEVISPDDSHIEVEQKVFEWLDAGAGMVLVVNPATRRITQYMPDRTARVLEESDVLDGGDVVPGWRVAVTDIFD